MPCGTHRNLGRARWLTELPPACLLPCQSQRNKQLSLHGEWHELSKGDPLWSPCKIAAQRVEANVVHWLGRSQCREKGAGHNLNRRCQQCQWQEGKAWSLLQSGNHIVPSHPPEARLGVGLCCHLPAIPYCFTWRRTVSQATSWLTSPTAGPTSQPLPQKAAAHRTAAGAVHSCAISCNVTRSIKSRVTWHLQRKNN
jgi:hypothetical protein